MITWKQALPDFEWLIHQVWYLQVEEGDDLPALPKLIPNPRAHILLTPAAQKYCYQSDTDTFSGFGSHLLTASDQILTLHEQFPLQRFGITLQPEGLYHLFGDTHLAINQCQQPDWLVTTFNPFFQSIKWNEITAEKVKTQLYEFLQQQGFEPKRDKASQLTRSVISVIDGNRVSVAIDCLAKRCCVTRRTLERSFKQVTGLSLKQYQTMMTLEKMVLAIYERGQVTDWAAFAQEFGFSDQPHLIRHLKRQLGATPSGYLSNRDLTLDIYGDFE
ncbi:AraC family transcriptional regulator [Vibrio sonorensis]|uniref:AraC family transcriptional regulator n=1 Tax=Vibrio sonorensis TaxID=1004316 RepID=UPI0008D98FE9|nr:helix-turn-helix domain-containing protein [Vibrio sonorensis]